MIILSRVPVALSAFYVQQTPGIETSAYVRLRWHVPINNDASTLSILLGVPLGEVVGQVLRQTVIELSTESDTRRRRR